MVDNNECRVVITNDGEEFEVPNCVISQIESLNGNTMNPIKLEIDSTLFTRVLHFIETYNGEETGVEYEYDTAKVDEFYETAKNLKIQKMINFFNNEIQRFENAKNREISWDEFCDNQKRSSFWILVDGFIYDITKWITFDERMGEIPHPGGSTPLQAIKTDSSYFFEIYHATNECYTLMKNFFIGKLKESDHHKIPKLRIETSPEFLDHLRSFTNAWTHHNNNNNNN